MVAFVLTPSERIHECLHLPSSCVTPGQTPQESRTKVMKWIETTVTSLPEFFSWKFRSWCQDDWKSPSYCAKSKIWSSSSCVPCSGCLLLYTHSNSGWICKRPLGGQLPCSKNITWDTCDCCQVFTYFASNCIGPFLGAPGYWILTFSS